jgi:O-acetylserine/cysteine efflux transporter
MGRRDISAALVCVVLWGLNFVIVDEGLRTFPPIFFAALRFFLTAFPAIFFVPRPRVGWRSVVAIGVLLCVLEFGCLFVAMNRGLPAGLASVVLQSQAVFTALFAAAALRERPGNARLLALSVAVAGLVLIGFGRSAAVPMYALLLGVAAGAAWGAGNVVTRSARPARPFSLLVYTAAVAPVPLGALSLVVEGWKADAAALQGITWTAVFCLAYVVLLSTLVGFGLWIRLLARHESSLVAPFTLLVPVVGLSAAWVFLGERPSMLEGCGCLIVLVGLAWLVAGGGAVRRLLVTARVTERCPCPRGAVAVSECSTAEWGTSRGNADVRHR